MNIINEAKVNSKKNVVRKAKVITNKEELDYLVNISQEDAARRSTIMNLFADFGKGAKYNTFDIIEIPAGKYGADKRKNKNKFTTTVGIWIFNKGIIEPVSEVVGYVNKTITKAEYNNINNKLSYALLEDKITVDQLKRFIMQTQIYMSCCSALAPSHSIKLLMLSDDMKIKRKELTNKYKDAIEAKDLSKIKDMEDELVKYSLELMGDDPSMDMFYSGARSTIENNYKNMYIVKGPVRLTDGSYDVVTSSYFSGLDKEEFVITNDSMVGGPYSRSNATAGGGYLEKQFINALQHVKVLGKGSDCKTNRYITVTITNKNKSSYMYSFVIQGSKLIELTSDNIDSYVNKTVKLRYSSLCESKNGICEKCAGTLFNRLGITNIGLVGANIASAIKNGAMKAFHDSTLKLNEMDVEKAFGYDKK